MECPLLEVDMVNWGSSQYKAHLADCVILTYDNKILMQQRPLDWGNSAGNLNIFGGHVEEQESVLDGLVRELNEETGALANKKDIVFIGAVSEDFTCHTELVHVHFWHDVNRTITGCYEAEAVEYHSVKGALSHPKIMDYAKWALLKCKEKRLIR